MGQRCYMIIIALTMLSSNIFIDCTSFEEDPSPAPVYSPEVVADVDDFGARGDGNDDSEAFKMAWEVACSSKKGLLVVPKNRVYLLKPIVFSGPCSQDTTVKIWGIIVASSNHSDYEISSLYWLLFNNIENLKVKGSGIIYGNGEFWWGQSCKNNKSLPCTDIPSALTFNGTRNLLVQGLKVKNPPKMHVRIENSTNVLAKDLVVTAPGDSPNTDGIHVRGSQNVRIKNIRIRTGDDCISIVNGSMGIDIKDITCGPGHGISIGSLGMMNSEAQVSNVMVSGVTLYGTTNGARIKSWVGGTGYARNIRFQDIVMHNVNKPILIDQYYCDQQLPCPTHGSGVEISDVVYKDINGSSASRIAIDFNCSSSSPCYGLRLQNIDLVGEFGESKASCVNANGIEKEAVKPSCNDL